ncbi:MAG: hypothetical protein LBM08_01435 [Dysgonamonadaceae bacterium]|jgi:hypothetical protein|nr:hypothetical protein [Dysgonamonadaceae bacterium]
MIINPSDTTRRRMASNINTPLQNVAWGIFLSLLLSLNVSAQQVEYFQF